MVDDKIVYDLLQLSSRGRVTVTPFSHRAFTLYALFSTRVCYVS